jgi:hypothetical protein
LGRNHWEMHLKDALPQVGAPDPELKNSPIVDHSEYDDRDGLTDVELEAGVCHFNGEAFAIGDTVRSGSDVLECAPRGVWVRKGVKRDET